MRCQQIDINSIMILQKQKRYKQYTIIIIKKQRYDQLTNNMKKKCRRNLVRGSKTICVGKIGFGVVPKSLCRQNQVRGVPKKFVQVNSSSVGFKKVCVGKIGFGWVQKVCVGKIGFGRVQKKYIHRPKQKQIHSSTETKKNTFIDRNKTSAFIDRNKNK